MSQPTLSRRMAELENRLGVPLLYRTSSGVTMTSEGQRLYRNASALLGTFEDFERDFRLEAGARGALIRISASDGGPKGSLFISNAEACARGTDRCATTA
jgi:DNA-binding transcriptional LysR family regulator